MAALLASLWLLAMTSLPAAGQTPTQTQPTSEALDPNGSTSGHKLILCTDGSVMGWGGNGAGQLGANASYLTTPATISVGLPNRAVRVAVASQTSYAVLADGTLWSWGDNTYGQLGTGSGTTTTATARQVAGLSQVVDVAGGFFHAVALCADGSVWSWGDRSQGVLGTGNSGATIEYLPKRITSLTDIRQIASGDQLVMALDASGRVWSWGANAVGELGLGFPANALTLQYTPAQIALHDVRQIDASNVRAAAVLANGTLYNWGQNGSGQLGLGHTGYVGTPAQVGAGTITDAVAVAMNTGATIAVRPSGTTYVWGTNGYGGLGMTGPASASLPIAGPTFSPNVQITGQNFQFTSLERTGAVKTWGGAPLGYTPAVLSPYGGSYTPITPTGVCPAVPAVASFPACGPQRAYYQQSGATYVAARHGNVVSPAEIGTYGTTTVIDASLPPYNGTVTFSGIYHVRGDVRLTGGTFNTLTNAVFYVDSDNGLSANANAPNYGLTTVAVQNATLDLRATTLQANCPARWGGIALLGNAKLYTSSGGAKGRVRSVVRDATVGMYSYTPDWHYANTNEYYLYATDFSNNDIGLYDLVKGTAQPGEGARFCSFEGGSVGIQFEAIDYTPTTVFGGDFGQALFEYNSFNNVRYGIYGSAGQAHIRNNTFTNNYSEAIILNATAAGTGDITQNTITVPAAWPAALIAQQPAGTVLESLGIWARGDVNIVANTVVGATTTPASNNVYQLGMWLEGSCQVFGNNTLRYLDEGIHALTEDYTGSTHYIAGNTFADNISGLTFASLYPYPYNLAPVSLTLRCNTFSTTQPNGVGVWVKANTPFPAALGSASAPNGNRFDGIADVTKRFVYDATNLFKYFRYNSAQEEFNGSSGNTILTYGGATSAATVTPSSIASPTGACGTSTTPGVYARSVAAPQGPGTADSPSLPTAIQLSAAYPNPVSETVSFTYLLPANSTAAALVLHDLMGREVARQPLADRAGEVRISVQHLPAGFYTSALEIAGHRQASHKLTIAH